MDARCEELGGVRLCERGEGDDDANIEDDFMQWREKFWSAMCDFYGVQPDKRSLSECRTRDYELKVRCHDARLSYPWTTMTWSKIRGL